MAASEYVELGIPNSPPTARGVMRKEEPQDPVDDYLAHAWQLLDLIEVAQQMAGKCESNAWQKTRERGGLHNT